MNFKKRDKMTSPICEATGGIIEALEKGHEVIHICEKYYPRFILRQNMDKYYL